MATKSFLLVDKTSNLLTQIVQADETVDVAALYPGSNVVPAPAAVPGTMTPQIGWAFLGGAWFPPFSAGLATTRLSLAQFRGLFTLAERMKLDGYATDTTLTADQTARMRTLYKDLEAVTALSLSSPTLKEDLDFLVTIGYLAADRETMVLAGQPPAATP